MEGLIAEDFDVAAMTCPKCGKPSKVYTLRATGDNFLVCRWPECAVGTMEGIYKCIWKSLNEEHKKKVMESRNETTSQT